MEQNENLDWAIWSDYPDYEFCENGDVYDLKGECLVPNYGTGRNRCVMLWNRTGERRAVSLMYAIATAFHGVHSEEFEPYPIDGDYNNVCSENLDWRIVGLNKKRKHSWDEKFRNATVLEVETGLEFRSVWVYIQETGERESLAKRCLKEPWRMTSRGTHLRFLKYVTMYGEEELN